jgi:hypothetical protein
MIEIEGLEAKIVKGMQDHLFFLQSQLDDYVLDLERREWHKS